MLEGAARAVLLQAIDEILSSLTLDAILEDLEMLEGVVGQEVFSEGLGALRLHAAPRDAQLLKLGVFIVKERVRDRRRCLWAKSAVGDAQDKQARCIA